MITENFYFMNDWMKSELGKQFDRAVRLGWLPFFIEAAGFYAAGCFDAADLIGIASRETNLDPKWLKNAGDGGHGFGLMQADCRSFPEWIKSGKWRDAREGILMGAKVLMLKWDDVTHCIGKRTTVKSSKTGTFFTFIGKNVSGAEKQTVTIAAYNSGRWAHYAVSKNQSADKYTTQGDYSLDAQARAVFFRPLLKEWAAKNMPVQSGLPSNKEVEQNQAVEPIAPSDDDLQSNNNAASAVVLTPTDNASGGGVVNAASESPVKDFADKYLKHCPTDSLKNIFFVVAARISAAATALWQAGFHGKILVFLISFAAIAPVSWAGVYYRARIVGWAKDIADSFITNE